MNFLSTEGKCVAKGYAVDPDEKMLALAKQGYEAGSTGDRTPSVHFLKGSAEKIPLADATVDTVLVGSAFHWFNREVAFAEITRVLRPGGILFIFEYQFPKCLDNPALHETVRRRFNLEWKAPVQTPRGTLAEITSVFRESKHWRLMSEERPIWLERLGLSEFLGHLFSQSRYLHAEAKQADPTAYREEIQTSLEPYFAGQPLEFDLKPRSFLFQKSLT